MNKYSSLILGIVFTVVLCGVTVGEDWPTYLHDKNRSGHTTEQLAGKLGQSWVWGSDRLPRPAGAETPALQDFWQNLHNNKSRLPVDSAFRVVVSDGKVYFGSSNSDKVICLDASDGSQLWKYYTGGPIRFAPSVYNGKVYFGSDDGYVYCLNGDDGSLVWRFSAIGNDERMMADGRMVSVCPVRTGVLVDNGVAYWGAGLFSGAKTNLSRFVCACNAETGALIWKKTPPRPLQGYPLASAANLYMPSGKTQPTFYSRSNGNYLGSIGAGRQGGAYALLTNDNKLFVGPHYSSSGSYIAKYDASSGSSESVAWGPGNCLVVTDTNSYYSSDTRLARIRRSNKTVVWSVASSYPYELILAGNILYAGGDNKVAAISTVDGSVTWSAPVNGRVRGLAVADGSLYVSTDHGSIHCFSAYWSGDIDQSNSVDMFDFVALAVNWLSGDCGDCGGADIVGDDGEVNFDDLVGFSNQWLLAMLTRYE